MQRERSLLYVLLMVLVAVVLAVGTSLFYTNRAVRDSDRQWCALIGRLATTYNDPEHPPQTELGRQIAEDFRLLYEGLDCPMS